MIKLGNNSIGKIYLGSSSIGKAYLGSDLVYQKGGGGGGEGIIPSTYKELTFAEVPLFATAQTYIRTGVVATNNIGFEIEALTYDTMASTGYGCIFGSRASSNSSDFQLTTYSESSSVSGTFRRGFSTENYNAYLATEQIFNAKLTSNTFITTVAGSTQSLNTSANISNGKEIYLFALNDNGSANQYAKVRIYSFKLTNSGTLILDYVPCMRKSDGVVGFYDLVSGSFVAPTSGTLYGVDEQDPNFSHNNFTWGKGGILTLYPGQSSGSTNPAMSMIGLPLPQAQTNMYILGANGYDIYAYGISNMASPQSQSDWICEILTHSVPSLFIPSGKYYEIMLSRISQENADITEGYKSLLCLSID